MPVMRRDQIPEGINLIEHQNTRNVKCTLHDKPFFLNDLVISDLNEFESSHNSNLFRIEVLSLKRHISLRANTLNDWVLWVEQINKAKHTYRKGEERFSCIDNAPVRSFQQMPIAFLTLASVEAFQLYTRHYCLNAYCKVAIGKDWSQAYSTLTTKTVRRVMDFRKNPQFTRDKSLLSRFAAGTRRSLALGSEEPENPHQIIWNTNAKLNVFEPNDSLFIQCFDANPFAPHQFLGEVSIPISDIIQQRRYLSNEQITKGVELKMPNEQLNKNFLYKLNIKPCLLIKFSIEKTCIQ